MGKPKQLSIQFEVKSNHPNIPTPTLLSEIQGALPEFEVDLSRQRTVERSNLRREGTLPISPDTARIALETFVATTGGVFGGELVKKFADDTYEWFKRKWPWASFSLKSVSAKGGGGKKSKAIKKLTKATTKKARKNRKSKK